MERIQVVDIEEEARERGATESKWRESCMEKREAVEDWFRATPGVMRGNKWILPPPHKGAFSFRLGLHSEASRNQIPLCKALAIITLNNIWVPLTLPALWAPPSLPSAVTTHHIYLTPSHPVQQIYTALISSCKWSVDNGIVFFIQF